MRTASPQFAGRTLSSARFRNVDILRNRYPKLLVTATAPILVATTIAGFASLFGFVGADARWLAALGRVIWTHQEIPASVPFASAPSAHWPNTLVLAQLIFHGLELAFGDRGLMLAQVVAAAAAIFVLAQDSLTGGATIEATVAALLLMAVGALPDLSVARSQLFSIALFPVVVALLRREARRPSRRIWIIVPLLALWSNLHGAALIGLGMTLVYLAVVRLRHERRTTVAVAIAAVLAICLTPAGFHTIDYYRGVLTNQAAARGQGLWAPLSLSAPLDVLLIITVIALVVRLRGSKPRLWELLVLTMLGVLTVKTSRSGIWLLFFLTPVAARSLKSRELWKRVLPPLGTVAVAVLLFAIARGPLPTGASPRLVARAIALSHGTPVLAEDSIAEQVALAGGKVWLSNPIDAFSKQDQNVYLDWLSGAQGGLQALAPQITVVLTQRESPAERLMARDRLFKKVGTDRLADLYVRTS